MPKLRIWLLALNLLIAATASHGQGCSKWAANQWSNEEFLPRVDYFAGKKVLIFDGGVDANAAVRAEAALKQHSPIDEVWLNSPGGLAVQGPEIGKVFRRYGVVARIPNGYVCASACNFAFVGAPIRHVDVGGQYAVHLFTVVGNENYRKNVIDTIGEFGATGLFKKIAEREMGSALLAIDQADYLIKMGISRRLLREVMYPQEAAGFTCLTQAQLRKYNVINSD